VNKLPIILIIGFLTITLTTGIVYSMNHIDYEDPDWKCKKWVSIVELAKQDYPHFVKDSLTMAERFCGFDINNLK